MIPPKVLHKRNIYIIYTAVKTLGNIIQLIDPIDATTYRDSGDGWTALEVLCHLRDADEMFYHRAQLILAQDYPDLPEWDHDQMVIDRRYNEQDMYAVYDTLCQSREQFIHFFEALTDDQWERAGNHPERSYPFTLTDALMQIATHDTNHTEQFTRILREKLT